MRLILCLTLLLSTLPVHAQVFRWSRDQMLHYTPLNPYDRFPDGRPKVPDAILEKVKALSLEEAWGILRNKGYHFQYTGPGFQILHPGKKLVGRAVTAQYLPLRPDLHNVIEADAKKAGLSPSANQKVIDLLQLNDVPVIDLMGPAPGHNFGGDNLHAAIYGATRTGAVIDGTIRDIGGIEEIGHQVIFRGAHPAAVAGVSVAGINVPVRIGDAICMPGDIILGDKEGVIFIPPHLVQEILDTAETTHLHDEWTKAKFLTGKYKASDLYPSPTKPELKKEYEDFLKSRRGK